MKYEHSTEWFLAFFKETTDKTICINQFPLEIMEIVLNSPIRKDCSNYCYQTCTYHMSYKDYHIHPSYFAEVLCTRKDIDENFVFKYKDKLPINSIFYNKKIILSEEIINEFLSNKDNKDRADLLKTLCRDRDLSLEFVKQHFDLLDYDWFKYNRSLGRSKKHKIRDIIKSYKDLL